MKYLTIRGQLMHRKERMQVSRIAQKSLKKFRPWHFIFIEQTISLCLKIYVIAASIKKEILNDWNSYCSRIFTRNGCSQRRIRIIWQGRQLFWLSFEKIQGIIKNSSYHMIHMNHTLLSTQVLMFRMNWISEKSTVQPSTVKIFLNDSPMDYLALVHGPKKSKKKSFS